MKNKSLIIITQTIDKDDSNLGFFCDWVREFATKLNKGKIYVIANKVGQYNLPQNVEVLSLGKEKGVSRFSKILKLWLYLFKYLPKSDGIFAHMCPEYIVAGGWLARFYGKRIGLWYLHKSNTWKLRLSEKIVNYIFTAHKDGFPFDSKKLVVTGHGISGLVYSSITPIEKPNVFNILTVGRISESKNLLILVKFAIILAQKLEKTVKFTIVGEAYLDKDKVYLKELKNYINENKAGDIVEFVGKVAHDSIASYYKQADIFVNSSHTGGVDKAVLEAMLMEVPVFTSNQAFANILPKECLFEDGNLDELVNKALNYKLINTADLYNFVMENHNLSNLVKKIIECYEPR